jgi:quercetin dioxygenase-like cupin family protein
MFLPRLLAIALIGFLPLAAQADNAYPAKDLLTTSKTVVGEDIIYPTTGPAKITASIVTVAPGANTIEHRHGVPLFAYILEGELTVDYGAHGKKVFKKGDALVETMGVKHRGMNLGTTTVSLLAVYIGAEGAVNVIIDK